MFNNEKYLILLWNTFFSQNHGISKTKSNDKTLAAYHREEDNSVSGDIQTLNVEEATVKQEGERTIRGDFSSIPNSEERLSVINHRIIEANHGRLLLPVVDTTKIQLEVLKGICGGRI